MQISGVEEAIAGVSPLEEVALKVYEAGISGKVTGGEKFILWVVFVKVNITGLDVLAE